MLQRIHYIFICCLLLFLVNGAGAYGQDRIEGGVFMGTSYYNGDLNPGRQFYNIHPAFGGMVRVVPNGRLAFKGTVTTMGISGSYPQKGILFPQEQAGSSYNFSRTFWDISTQLEINFFEYDDPQRKEETRFTPYITGGLAYSVYRPFREEERGLSENPHFILSLPFGLGVKWKPVDWMHVGLEWSFRKTFVDDLDAISSGTIDPMDPFGFEQSSTWHNNDWYSYAGVFIAFDLFHRRTPCYAGF